MGIGLFWNGLDLVWAGVALLRANNGLLKWATVWLRYVSGANAYEIPLFRRYVSVHYKKLKKLQIYENIKTIGQTPQDPN